MMLNKWDYNDTLINEKIKDEIIIAGFYRFVKNFFQKHKKLYFVNSFATTFLKKIYANFCISSSNNSADVLYSKIPLG